MVDDPMHRVKTKLFLATNRPVLHALDGQYRAIERGRSLDFEDLREYVPGDEVRDIDWKATARARTPLVRRHRADRRAGILFVVDRGPAMTALAEGGEVKRDLASFALGALGSIAVAHGDEVALLTRSRRGQVLVPPSSTTRGLTRLVRLVGGDGDDSSPAPADAALPSLVERAVHLSRGFHFVVVVTDDVPWPPEMRERVRMIARRRDLIWLTITDANPFRIHEATGADRPGSVVDAVTGRPLSDLLLGDDALRREFELREAHRQLDTEEAVTSTGTSWMRVGRTTEVLPALLTMLKERARVRR